MGLMEATLNKMHTLISTTEDFLQSCFSSEENLTIELNDINLKNDIVDPILDELRDDLLNHRITVVNRLNGSPSHPTSVQGDRVALKSAFRNLLTNAIKHGGEGCTINIGLENHHSTYQLQVYNSGPTIPPKSVPRYSQSPCCQLPTRTEERKAWAWGCISLEK